MLILFYLAATIAVISTVLVITGTNAVHALLYLVVSLLAISFVFFLLGAPFAAALEVIIYAGAIMVLFIFVIMMLNLGTEAEAEERRLLEPGLWKGPASLTFVLFAEIIYLLVVAPGTPAVSPSEVGPGAVGEALFGPYILAVEIASFLLLAGLVGARRLGKEEGMTT
jgi:NADH-quinone oxidoreductase subunit J